MVAILHLLRIVHPNCWKSLTFSSSEFPPLSSAPAWTGLRCLLTFRVILICSIDIPDILKGPFYCWFEALSSEQVNEAHKVIYETIEEEGPFDGVIAFSQGASVILSMLLHREIHHPHDTPPFKFALFFCSIAVISPDSTFNEKYIEKYSRYYRGELSAADFDADDDSDDDPERDDAGEAKARSSARNEPVSRPKKAPKHRIQLALRHNRRALVDETRGPAS